MTIASETSRVNLVGNGVNDTFTFTFEIYVKTDLLVYVAGELQAVDVNYTIADEAIENPDGGDIVFGAEYIPALDAVVSIILNVPITQLIDYVETDKFPAETHERGLDRLVKIAQRFKEQLSRTPSLIVSSALSDLTIPEAASRVIGWDALAEELTTYPITPVLDANWDSIQNYGNDLATAVATIGAGAKTLLIDVVTETITTNLEVPETLELFPTRSGMIVLDDCTLTINRLSMLTGIYQIFNCLNGAEVKLGYEAVERILPQWFPGSDLGTQFNNSLVCLPSTGGNIGIPPGEYTTATEPTISGIAGKVLNVWAYGATIKTSEAISGLKITASGSTMAPIAVFGYKIDHEGNANATYGIDLTQCWNVHLYDPVIVADDSVQANYAAIRLANSDPDNDGTGTFWTQITHPWIRVSSGGAAGDIPIGILLQGAANATRIEGGGINHCAAGVKVTVHTGKTYLANGWVIDGVNFETYTTGVHVDGAVTSNIAGHRIINNRFEAGTTVISYTTTTTQPSRPPFLAGNDMVSDAGTYLNNPNSLYINSLDMSITPSIAGDGMTWKQSTKIAANSAAIDPLTLVPVGGGRGLKIREGTDANDILQLLWSGVGNEALIKAITGAVPNLQMTGVKGISGTGLSAYANNLRGSATFVTAAQVAVSFGTNEPDTSYYIALGGNAEETFCVSDKAVGGFNLNSSNAGSTATVDWILIR